jgi:hypothetical protein
MPASGSIPSLTQVRAWDTGHLTEAATRWTATATATMWEDAFTHVSIQITKPGDTPWEGVAAEAAQERAYSDRLKVAGLADRLRGASSVARRGADQIAYARQRVLDAVRRAEQAGFTVGEDFSVTSYENGSPAQLVARHARAKAYAADIRARAGELVAADRQTATGITSATAGVGGSTFGDARKRAGDEDALRLVDFRQSPGDDTTTPQVPGGGYGSYHYGYQFSTAESRTKEQIMSEIQKHFNKYFTFTADEGEFVNGATIDLKGPFGENEPVKVASLTPDSFSFISLPGHNEGAGRTITFSIVPSDDNPIPGRLNWELRVAASGPLAKGSLVPGASWLNKGIWQVFADNLNAKLPTLPAQPGLATV